MHMVIRIAPHGVVFAVVYAVVRRPGAHGEIPYIIASLATVGLAHLTCRRHWRRGR